MTTFGLITEGETDQIVIENILCGYFKSDISGQVNPLQPSRDATDEDESTQSGGWTKVLDYCKSEAFKESFNVVDYIIIQIDTDTCEEVNYDVKATNSSGKRLSPEVLAQRVKHKIISEFHKSFGISFYPSFKSRIIFAISVEQIECWLLPLYYNNYKKSNTKSCEDKLIRGTILKNIKVPKNYSKYERYDLYSKSYRKNRELLQKGISNPSLDLFIRSLSLKFPYK